LARRLLIRRSVDKVRAGLAAAAIIAMAAFVLPAQDKPTEAWWLHATFTPTETAYESLPVSDIAPDWVKIKVLSYGSLPPEAKEDLPWMHRDGFVFRVDNYFKRKGLERELCGVFEDRNGRKGRFLLVLEKPAAGSWKVAFVHQEVGEAGFSVFRRKNGLYWGTCMQCEEFSRLRLKQGSFQLESAP
jgi:hypothetical protein